MIRKDATSYTPKYLCDHTDKLLGDLEVRFIDCAENDAIVHQSLQG